ncbi:hypothetical protein D3C87_459890 [compost metagenome]
MLRFFRRILDRLFPLWRVEIELALWDKESLDERRRVGYTEYVYARTMEKARAKAFAIAIETDYFARMFYIYQLYRPRYFLTIDKIQVRKHKS